MGTSTTYELAPVLRVEWSLAERPLAAVTRVDPESEVATIWEGLMRRSGRMTVLAVLLLTAWPGWTVGQSEAPGASSTPGDLAGPLTVDVPPGAAPAGVTISVERRDPSERPDELKAVPMKWAFYELQPSDVSFSAPVPVTRSIGFGELDMDRFDPIFDGLVVGSLFTRDAAGTWSWLDDGQVRLDPDEGAFLVGGTTHHGGPIMAYVAGDLIVATEDASPTPVGQTFRVEGQLRVDPTSGADIADVAGRTSDETIARPVRSYDVESFDRAQGLELECLAPGTVTYETTFAVRDVADVSPLRDVISLPATDVAVIQTGEHTCGG